jgi:hypothetical protein
MAAAKQAAEKGHPRHVAAGLSRHNRNGLNASWAA